MFKKKRRKSAGKRSGRGSYPFSFSGLYTDPVSFNINLIFFTTVSLSGQSSKSGHRGYAISGI